MRGGAQRGTRTFMHAHLARAGYDSPWQDRRSWGAGEESPPTYGGQITGSGTLVPPIVLLAIFLLSTFGHVVLQKNHEVMQNCKV